MHSSSHKNLAATQQTSQVSDSSRCNLDNVTHMPHIVKFVNELRKSGVGLSGQITKLATLLNAVKMLVI